MPNVTLVFPEPLHDGTVAHIQVDEQEHFHNTVNRAVWLSQGSNVESATIQLGRRTQPKSTNGGHTYDQGGWLEHHIIIRYNADRQLVVGAIQRAVGAA